MMDYDTFPMKRFFRILQNPDLLEELKLSKDDFETLKEQWSERHPTAESTKLVEAHRKVIIEGIKIQRNIHLFQSLSTYNGDIEELFEVIGMKYDADPTVRLEKLKKEIVKSEQKLKIFDAQRDIIEKEIKETQQDRNDNVDINEVMASFELHGFTINDYETFPMGRYDAYTKLISKKEKANG